MNLFKKIQNSIYYCVGLLILLITNVAFANTTIIIHPNTIISFPKTYDGVTLDLSHGNFIIKNHATLTIKNSAVFGTLSKANPVLFAGDALGGNIVFLNSQFNIHTAGIAPHPTTQAMQYLVQMGLGNVIMRNNEFTIDNTYTSGLLLTTASISSTGYQIVNNRFEKFHGVLYLIGSDNALIKDNTFFNNSYGNIVLIGNNGNIIGNKIYFSGNNRLGNSIDIIDSDSINISKNLLLTPTCHGIYIVNSHNLMINNNRVMGGITYAMTILTNPETIDKADTYVKNIIANYKIKNLLSNNITIEHNYMAQNRYGIAATDVDRLIVQHNIFIQRFEDKASRKFWTDNNVLLKNVTHLTWTNNLYKEAFTQAIDGDNSQAYHFVLFPKSGGVTL